MKIKVSMNKHSRK